MKKLTIRLSHLKETIAGFVILGMNILLSSELPYFIRKTENSNYRQEIFKVLK